MRLRAGLAAIALLAAVTSLPGSSAAAEFRVPALAGPVVDDAGMLSRTSRARIESALRALREQGATQLVVLTVPNLQGLPIEQASIQIVDRWKLGSEKEDNGVLLLVAQEERRVRIEVGQGLEGALTDAHSKRIIDESMMPLFREGDFDAGITLGVFEIAQRTNPTIDLRPHLEGSLRQPRSRSSGGQEDEGFGLLAVLLFVSIAFARAGLFGGRSRRGRYLWGAGMGAGLGLGGHRGGGFGGGFSGGFGGGGGGFSGGGASGGW